MHVIETFLLCKRQWKASCIMFLGVDRAVGVYEFTWDECNVEHGASVWQGAHNYFGWEASVIEIQALKVQLFACLIWFLLHCKLLKMETFYEILFMEIAFYNSWWFYFWCLKSLLCKVTPKCLHRSLAWKVCSCLLKKKISLCYLVGTSGCLCTFRAIMECKNGETK